MLVGKGADIYNTVVAVDGSFHENISFPYGEGVYYLYLIHGNTKSLIYPFEIAPLYYGGSPLGGSTFLSLT